LSRSQSFSTEREGKRRVKEHVSLTTKAHKKFFCSKSNCTELAHLQKRLGNHQTTESLTSSGAPGSKKKGGKSLYSLLNSGKTSTTSQTPNISIDASPGAKGKKVKEDRWLKKDRTSQKRKEKKRLDQRRAEDDSHRGRGRRKARNGEGPCTQNKKHPVNREKMPSLLAREGNSSKGGGFWCWGLSVEMFYTPTRSTKEAEENVLR